MNGTKNSGSEHHQVTIGYKCPMPGCGLKQTATWESYELPSGLEGVSIGDTLEGPFHCPDCEDRGVAHSGLFEVMDVGGEPVNTDHDPRTLTDGGTSDSERPLEVEAYGLVMWMGDDGTTPVEIHAVMEYLNDRGLLTERGEDLYTVFWEQYLQTDGEHESTACTCPVCTSKDSEPTGQGEGELVCRRCGVKFDRRYVDTGSERSGGES